MAATPAGTFTQAYTCDGVNRLCTAQETNPAGTSGLAATVYAYDDLGEVQTSMQTINGTAYQFNYHSFP